VDCKHIHLFCLLQTAIINLDIRVILYDGYIYITLVDFSSPSFSPSKLIDISILHSCNGFKEKKKLNAFKKKMGGLN